MKNRKLWMRRLINGTLVSTLAATLVLAGLFYGQSSGLSAVQDTVQNVFTIGTAEAAGVADQTADGVDDNVQAQALVTALPATGGRISILTGVYVWANATTVTRAIDNIHIDGTGYGTYIDSDGVTAPISAGGDNWVISNMHFDAPGPDMGATTGWEWRNVTVGATYYAYRTPVASTTATEWEIPTGRSATFTVAASDALASSIAQADYVCDGTDDHITIQAVVDAVAALGGGDIYLTEGTFNGVVGGHVNSQINMASNVTLRGAGSSATTLYQIYINADAVSGWALRDLKLDMTGFLPGSMGNYSTVQTLNQASDYLIDNVFATNGNAHNFALYNSTRGRISNCRGENSYDDNFAMGIGSTHLQLVNNIAIGQMTPNGSSGFEIDDGGSDFLLVNNTAIGGTPPNNSNVGFEIHMHVGFDGPTGIRIIGCSASGMISAGFTMSRVGGGVGAANSDIIIIGSSSYSNGTQGFFVSDSVNVKLIGVSAYDNTNSGILITTNAYDVQVNSCSSFENAEEGIKINAGSVIAVNEGSYYLNGKSGIKLATSGITVRNASSYNNNQDNAALGVDSVGIGVGGADSTVEGNILYDDQVAPTQKAGILVGYPGAILRNNRIWGNVDAQIYIQSAQKATAEYSRRCVDMFMDVLAVSATHVRSNEDLSAGIPITFTIDAQPDVPRTLSGHFDAHANITAYTIAIVGIDAKGRTLTETMTEADGWDWETDNAFATITSIKMSARTGTGVGDTMDIGITDVLGLSDLVWETADVYKIKKNNANAVVALAQVNVTYDTYDMAVIGLAATDDFTIWFRSNLNVIS
ncbi:MAG: right-handed parallel beta-helix repeat-containing protein [Proteobacteria bacterium]|nr:right-handed parallel beta-helix repeat-containing protein [Pseudomonadota bacterium]